MSNEKLAIVIPARNEIYLQRTIDGILEKAEGDIEVIAILDGYDVPVTQEGKDSRVKVIRNKTSIGQRASTNLGARSSDAKYFMKCDAHVSFDQGFDVKLEADFEDDWTVMPQMYIIDGQERIATCPKCHTRTTSKKDSKGKKHPYYCKACDRLYEEQDCLVIDNPSFWQPKWHKKMDFMYISNEPGLVHRAQYWYKFAKRPEAKQDLVEVMTGQGAVWFQDRKRFLDLGGLDEGHGSWGQVGMEVACKAWLSGGRHLINKKTWFAHWFRGNNPGFPYPLRQKDMNYARDYSRDLWRNSKWPLQKLPLTWLVRKFWPVPTWTDEAITELDKTCNKKAIIYYTDGTLDSILAEQIRKRLKEAAGDIPIISVSQKKMYFETDVRVGKIGRSHLSMFKQILAGLEKAKEMGVNVVFLAEHDCLYSPEHFKVSLYSDKKFFYNNNFLWVRHGGKKHGQYSKPPKSRKLMSQLTCNRECLTKAIKERIAMLEKGLEMPRGIVGICEPGANEQVLKRKILEQCKDKNIDTGFLDGFFDWKSEDFATKRSNLDIRHGGNWTGTRNGTDVSDTAPYWGKMLHALSGLSYRVIDSKWYQPATIDGVKMLARFSRSRQSKFYGQGRWDNFIEPLIPFKDCKNRVFVDAGCNAGMYLVNAADMGFGKVIGIEANKTYFDQACFLLEHYDHKIKVINKTIGGDMQLKELPIADITLAANVLYWIKPKLVQQYVDQLAEKTLYCLVVSRDMESRKFASKANGDFVKAMFGSNWQLEKVIENVDQFGDPAPTPMFSMLFKSNLITRYKVDDLYNEETFCNKAVYRDSYKKFNEKAMIGRIFDVRTTDFYKYVVSRGKWGNDPIARVRKWGQTAYDIKKNGQKTPIEINSNGSIEHGLHRLIVCHQLNKEYIVAYTKRKK